MTEGRDAPTLAPEDGLMLLMVERGGGGMGEGKSGSGEKKRKRKEGEGGKKKGASSVSGGVGTEKSNGFLKPFSSKHVVFQDGTTARSDAETHGIGRVAFGAFSGKWFFEVEVVSTPNQDCVRIGCITDQGELNSALGDHPSGYGYHSNGTLTQGGEKIDSLSTYSAGDVIGCILDLGHLDVATGGGTEFFAGSSVTFLKNGVLQEGGFKNLLKGTYFAAVSLSSGAVIRLNPGPDFKFAPENQTPTAISHLVPVHLRNAPDEGQLKQKPRLKKAVAEGGDSQLHYNQCCHHCRAKPRPGLGVLRCSNHPCTRIFCLRCIRKYYSSHGDETALRNTSDSGKWICLCCTNSCVCKACQRVRFRKQENLVGGGGGGGGGKSHKGTKEKAQQGGPWAQGGGEVALETYDMEAAFGLATLFSMRNSQKPNQQSAFPK
uniref:B30.2/SPRY domain-containing protein n=1 Tax=Paramoeba aestuarina TaxID=180227 RepID=A0A7S4P5D6_9EUKA|mmetsp:Transcript_36381/g.57022  ORF Transcript_36381/g.57022 Transcript_36381/m.57022 type:complete len:433 (+) Transcript_36381:130-1428(+)